MKWYLWLILTLPFFHCWADPPVTFESFDINGYYSEFTFENKSEKTIEAFEFTFQFFDAFGETVLFYNQDHKSLRVDIPFRPGKSSFLWILSNQERFHELKSFRLDRVAFTDGTIWVNDDGFDLLFEVTIREIPRGFPIIVDVLAYGNKLNAEGRSWIRIVDEFERLNPNIDIQYDLLFEEAYDENMTARIRRGDHPHMAFIRPHSSGRLNWNNSGQSWDHKEYLEDMYDLSLIPSHGSRGEINYIPLGTSQMTAVLFMNESLVTALGYSKPETFEDLINMVPGAQQRGLQVISINGADKWTWGTCLLSTFIARTSGDPRWFSKAASGEYKFTDKPFIDALTIIEMLVQNDLITPQSLYLTYSESIAQFSREEALFMVQGQWAGNSIEDPLVAARTSLLPWPVLPMENDETAGTVASVPQGGYGLTRAGAENIEIREAALAFLNYYNREAEAVKRLEAGQIVSPVLSDWIMPQDLPPIIKSQIELSQTAGMTQAMDGLISQDLTASINQGIQEIVGGTATPEEIAQRVESIRSAERN